MAVVCVCSNCGHSALVKGENIKCPLYCSSCKTQEQRDKMAKDNIEAQDRLVELREKKEWIYAK